MIGDKFLDIGLGDNFLDLATKAKATKAKINKWDYMKLKTSVQEIINKMKSLLKNIQVRKGTL